MFRFFFFGMLFLCAAPVHARQAVDMIVVADHVVTVDLNQTVVSDGAVAIHNGIIVAVGTREALSRQYVTEQLITGDNQVLMPGLVNGHTHSAMVLFRGLADDLGLMEWLTQHIFPAEIRFVDEDFVRIGTRLACLEMIKGGTTTFVDMYFHPEQIAEVVEQCGVRAVVAAAVIEQESGYAKNFTEAMRKAERFINLWKNRNSRVTPAFAAHSPYTVSPQGLSAIRKRARALGVGISIHLSESRAEMDIVTEAYGDTSINHLENIDFFAGPTIGAHVVVPTKEEIPILAKRGVGAIHNPTSNMKVAAGVAPVPEMLDAGVNVGLGTDGAASNNDLDMWEEIRMAALIHKGRLLDPEVMPAARVLSIATNTGAQAIGLNNIGSLEVGKRADMILVSMDAVHLVPLYDVVSHLVYATDAQDVQTVIVDGELLMQDRVVLTLDEPSVILEAKAFAARIQMSPTEATGNE